MRTHVFVVSLFFLFCCCFSSAQKIQNDDLDNFINSIIKQNKLPGLSIAIVIDDSVIYAKGFGVKKIGESDPVNEHTLFQAASITKSFTASLIGILVDQKKIKWTDPVIKYIPGFETSEPFVTKRLTVQDLLTLRSGILDGDTLTGANRKDLIPQIKNLKISNSFRTGVSSFNLNFTLAGHIAEVIEGKTWEEMIRKEIFIPLKMNETYTSVQTALSATKNVSTPYYVENEKIVPTKWENFGLYSPADCIISNVMDLAKWIRLQLQNGTFENPSIISSETLNIMQSPQFIAPNWTKGLYNPNATFMTLGYGWFVSDYKGINIIEMGGAAPGTTNLLSIIPSYNVGIITQTNMDFAFESLVAIKFKILDDLILQRNNSTTKTK